MTCFYHDFIFYPPHFTRTHGRYNMIDLASLDTCRCFVFREILLDQDQYFEHFMLDEQHNLRPGFILSESEHFDLVNRD